MKLDKKRIFCWPTRKFKENPFIQQFREGLEENGAVVEEFSIKHFLTRKYDYIIIHFPDHFSSLYSLSTAYYRTFVFLSLFIWQKLLGAQVIRVAHDVVEVMPDRKWLLSVNRGTVMYLTDRYVFLSKSSRSAFLEKHPEQADKPYILAFHPRFDEDSHRTVLHEGPPRTDAVRYVGDIRRYKGLDTFLLLVINNPEALKLEIYGRADAGGYDDEIEQLLDEARAAGADISWQRGRPARDEFLNLITTARALVLPYRYSGNSGMAMNALETATPLIAPDLPIFREIQSSVGEEWVILYKTDGSDFLEKLEIVRSIEPDRAAREKLSSYLDKISWDQFSCELSDFLAGEKQPEHVSAIYSDA